MEVTVSHIGAVQFEIHARGQTLISDQPEANGGFNEGLTPPELLLAALGSCAGYYAAEYLNQQQLATVGVQVRVTAEKVKLPARLDRFRVEVTSPVKLTPDQQQALTSSVEKCLVHNTLLHPPSITVAVTGTDH